MIATTRTLYYTKGLKQLDNRWSNECIELKGDYIYTLKNIKEFCHYYHGLIFMLGQILPELPSYSGNLLIVVYTKVKC